MNVLITGGTGLIGREICQALKARQAQITILSRQDEASVKSICGSVDVIHNLDEYMPAHHFDVVINLAGEPIVDKAWSNQRKQTLRESRIDLTQKLVDKIRASEQPPALLLSGSAIGYYGNQATPVDDLQTDVTIQQDFAAKLCHDWEEACQPLNGTQTQVIHLRTGLVLSPKGGILEKMKTPFRFGLGGRIGNGQQMMSWIHITDYVNAVLHLIDSQLTQTSDSAVAYNLTAPHPVSNQAFSKTLAGAYGWKKLIFNVPAGILKLAMGERSSLLIEGQAVIPKRLLSEGFQFKFETLDKALGDLIQR